MSLAQKYEKQPLLEMVKGIIIGLAGSEARCAGNLADRGVGVLCTVGRCVGQAAAVDIGKEPAKLCLEDLRHVGAIGVAPFCEAGERQAAVPVSLPLLHLTADASQNLFSAAHTTCRLPIELLDLDANYSLSSRSESMHLQDMP